MTSLTRKNPPRIATMAAPGRAEDRRALVVSIYHARELLSSVERAILHLKESLPRRSGPSYPTLFADTEAAMTNLSFAAWLNRGWATTETGEGGDLALALKRADAAALAALGHGRLADSYSLFVADSKMSLKAHSHWHKATELARQEAHRALALVAEMFPSAYATEIGDESFVSHSDQAKATPGHR